MSDLTVSDALALGKENEGCNSGGWFWIVILFIFAMMNGGFGFGGGREAPATSADIHRGFDTNTMINKLDNLSSNLNNNFNAQNTTLLQGFNGMGNAIANLGFDAQKCCCETNRNIDAVRYESAKNTCDIITNATANTQRILDKMCQNEVDTLRRQLQLAEVQISQLTQTGNIVNALRPTPIPAYIACSPYAPANNYNNSCAY